MCLVFLVTIMHCKNTIFYNKKQINSGLFIVCCCFFMRFFVPLHANSAIST